ncbi:MAG: beta-ketoacyl-[acyl-carrier-protein] synthase family protein [Verrucomicrobiota bacterium]
MSLPPLIRLLQENPIAVTGLGCYSAAGDSVPDLWENAAAGRSAAAWRNFDGLDGNARFAVASAPDIALSRAKLRPVQRADRAVQMAWMAAGQAWQQAGLSNAYPPERVGVAIGSSRGPIGKVCDSLGFLAGKKYPPSFGPDSTFACLSGALAQSLNLKGPGATFSATCASAAFAIGYAAEQILLGKADAMLVGGSEAPLHPVVLAQLQAAGVLGFHEDATLACRPFDQARNGIVLGEGSGFLVLESMAGISKRGVEPLARLAGWATGLDKCGRTGVDETGSGLLRLMREALQVAEMSAGQVDYINAHGTGTLLNDQAEARAVHELLGERAAEVPCSSTKPVTGHCLGATPALEAILCVEALRHQIIPPTATCREQDPLCPIHVQPLVSRPANISTILSNSLGFWGYHAVLVFSKDYSGLT